jgi:hypothetical protein
MPLPSLRAAGRLAVAMLAAVLPAAWTIGAATEPSVAAAARPPIAPVVLQAPAPASCPPVEPGAVLQGTGAAFYLVLDDGALRSIPDAATLRSLGYDPNGADPIRDDCLRALRVEGEAPRVADAGRAARAEPPPNYGPPVVLAADAADAPRRGTVRLVARIDVPDADGLLLAISASDDAGGAGGSRLVGTCAGAAACALEVSEDRAASVTYVATVYACSGPDACVAVRDSNPVGVTWR